MKNLFCLINDCGDGSYYPRFTFNEDWIVQCENDPEYGYPSMGCDGDGFHYTVLKVPDECTLESLGISYDCAQDDD